MVIGISCKRNAPRDEPVFLGYDVGAPNAQSPIRDPNLIQTPTGSKRCDSRLQHLYCYYKALEDDLTDMLKKLACSTLLSQLRLSQLDYSKKLEEEILLLEIVPDPEHLENDFSALVDASQISAVGRDGKQQTSRPTSDKLPNTLCVLFNRNRKDFNRDREHGSWDARRLVGLEALTINANPLLANSEKHTFNLTAFVLHRPTNIGAQHDQVVAFIKSGEEWHYYKDGKTIALPNNQNQAAIRLASKHGSFFFYQKM
ncbi:MULTISPECIES: hypothetical protein [unclassified Candidatus Cardinium]|uniref:hypothetical protein n=1 Tax=unclassified Candidatus Cardinium TaxID=2641185 RepID=UPI001FB40430|nr:MULTISPECIES: hypothetical protein [unclassified Candidatus Cardinium]